LHEDLKEEEQGKSPSRKKERFEESLETPDRKRDHAKCIDLHNNCYMHMLVSEEEELA